MCTIISVGLDLYKTGSTYWPRDVWRSSVTRVDVPGAKQLLANKAYCAKKN